jgi:hypothetical protein
MDSALQCEAPHLAYDVWGAEQLLGQYSEGLRLAQRQGLTGGTHLCSSSSSGSHRSSRRQQHQGYIQQFDSGGLVS